MCLRRVRAAWEALCAFVRSPLTHAALVALCGVWLIVFGRLQPPGSQGPEPQRTLREWQRQKHEHALAELLRAGASGPIQVVDAGDGLGLGVTRAVEAGDVLLEVPEALALDVDKPRSCRRGPAGASSMDCQIERAVVQSVSRNEASRLTGLIALLLMERRRGLGLVPGLTAGAAVLATLPEPGWQAENGLFAIDEEELRALSPGTSMEGWREAAANETAEAHAFIQGTLAAQLGEEIDAEEVQWAYLMLHAHGQWAAEDGLGALAGLELPQRGVLFLWPLLLARPTPEWEDGVRLRHDAESGRFFVTAGRRMQPGEEVLFVDRRLSDASALCFRGLWLSGHHRARLSLDVSAAARDPEAQPLLQEFGCGAQPLRLFVQARRGVDPLFMGCMRMLALAGNASALRRAVERGWAGSWPRTGVLRRSAEAAAAELAVGALQQALGRLGASGAEIRGRFGGDPVALRPTVRVREAETMVVVGLLKSMRELQLLSANEYLYEALRENTERASRPDAARAGAEGGAV